MSYSPEQSGARAEPGHASTSSSSSSSTSVAAVAGASAKSLACPAVLSVPARHIVAFAPNSLADVLFCLPALAALRESFPGAQLSCVSRPSLAPIVRASHLVDEVLERPRGGLSAQASLLLKLHAQRPDIAVAFSSTRNVVLMAWSSGAPIRAGFEEAKMEALLTHRVKRNGPPRIEAFLELTRFLGCKTPHLDYCGLLDAGPEANLEAGRLLESSAIEGRFVLASPNPGTPGEARGGVRWPEEKWARALASLACSWPVVLIGSPSPRLMSQADQLRAGQAPRIVDVGGRASLLAQASLCSQAALLVGGDSGLLHLASAMETPVVGLYEDSASAGKPSRPEPRGRRRILSVRAELEPGQVLAQARELIGL